ncbi:M14 family zinc carboxypeptidase [Aureicoccus marinus]|uniref:M14 family zinc carboxypeptidase n=1 Tax=Aureicoccus marinus TaxID=754435 RepID=UPI001FE5C0CF|nr:M14 family zinc carboxypeptidase [Aureicoccus marinus]
MKKAVQLLCTGCVILLLQQCKEALDTDAQNWVTPYEEKGGTQTPTYEEVISFYLDLAKAFPSINVQTLGKTDSGQPLHLVTYNPDGNFNFQKIGEDKALVLINNGIHPGESDGIDACMMLMRDLATGEKEVPKNTVIASIPIYNVGGALNRNSTSRVNQNGPAEYGFRGNARNYDLNRDFIKPTPKMPKPLLLFFT